MSTRFLLALATVALPTALRAQNVSLVPRYYAGAGLYSSAFQVLGSPNGITTIPVLVMGGYQWRPRWAVQLSAAYSGNSSDFTHTSYQLDPNTGAVVSRSYTSNIHGTDRQLSVALLARRTLTRQARHRFQVDAVGGFTYERGSYYSTVYYTHPDPQATPPPPRDYQGYSHHLLAGLGPGFRFRPVARLEVLLDVLLNTPLYPQGASRLQSATTLGLRYRFGPAS